MRITLLFVLTLSGLFGCGPERYSWNQRMTVTVQTPDGLVTGSSVIEVRVVYNESGGGLAGDVQFRARHSGEAVAVEVRPGQYLFVPVRVPSSLLFSADPGRFGGPEVGFPDDLPLIAEQTEPFFLCEPGGFCPDMIALVERAAVGLRDVRPETMAEVFGEGYAIAEVTLEVTDDPVSSGVMAEVLHWTCTDFDPEQPGIRPILKFPVDLDGTQVAISVPYREFSTEQFCQAQD